MATIKYKGMELEVFSSDKPVIFDQQKKCVVWDEPLCGMKQEAVVLAYIPYRATNSRVIGLYNQSWGYCAILPEKPATRRATWEQLAYWLIDGKGLVLDADTNRVDTGVYFDMKNMHEEVGERYYVKARGESKWHEPTVDYMGLEEA